MKIAINGFGRIGRLFFRQAWGNKNLDIVAINDLGDVSNLAYLLKYDTVYRMWDVDIKADSQRGVLIVERKEIKFIQEKDPSLLPWKDLDIDVVVESTGVFESFEKTKVHLDAGAKRVVITAPAKDLDSELGQTVLVGVNEEKFLSCKITSNGSCTTNSASPVIAVLSKNPGIEKAILTTVHSYTATQSLVDGPVKGTDFRRGRAAAFNIVPSTTGAAIAVTRAIKELDGKFDGIAIRVPSIVGSLSDITFISKRPTSAQEINDILKEASLSEQWKGILQVTEEDLVSSDIIGRPYGAIVDTKFTKVIDGTLVKVLSWYDNEWGYVSTLIKHLERIKI
jgi:glyceraldehyde 3-phosphate dehydrogenase